MFGVGKIGKLGGVAKASGAIGFGGPAPVMFSDFKNGVYTFNGVNQSFATQWDAANQGIAAVVPGVGWMFTRGPGPFVDIWLQAKAQLVSAITPNAGFTVAMDAKIDTQDIDGAPTVTVFATSYNDGVYSHQQQLHFGFDPPTGTDTGGELTATTSAIAINPVSKGVLHRMAGTFTPTTESISLDGGAVVSGATSSFYNADINSYYLEATLESVAVPFTPQALMIVERIAWWLPQDPSLLPTISHP